MTNIFVGNLSTSITEPVLRSTFEEYGQVKRVKIGWNFAVIGMEDEVAANSAVSDLNSRTSWFLREYPQ